MEHFLKKVEVLCRNKGSANFSAHISPIKYPLVIYMNFVVVEKPLVHGRPVAVKQLRHSLPCCLLLCFRSQQRKASLKIALESVF
jgi:hypothetical protein